jgi:hypothetical protein
VERRLSPRKYLQLGVMLEIPSSSQPVRANLLDISMSGAFIETEAVLSISTPLIMGLKLSIADLQNSFRLYARVVRRTCAGVGVAFLPMPHDLTDALSRALSRYEQSPPY